MLRKPSRQLYGWTLIVLLLTGLTLLLSALPVGQALELVLLDARLWLRSCVLQPSGRIVVLAQDTLLHKWGEQYTAQGIHLEQGRLSRKTVADALTQLAQEGQPDYTVMDMLYSHSTHPQADEALGKALNGLGERVQLVTVVSSPFREAQAVAELDPSTQRQLCQQLWTSPWHQQEALAHLQQWLAFQDWLKARQLERVEPTVANGPLPGQTFCQVTPIVPALLQPKTRFAITRVEYDDKVPSLRQVPTLFQLADGSVHAYSALQAYLDLATPQSGVHSVSSGQLGVRQRILRLSRQGGLLIPWRHGGAAAAREKQWAIRETLHAVVVPRLLAWGSQPHLASHVPAGGALANWGAWQSAFQQVAQHPALRQERQWWLPGEHWQPYQWLQAEWPWVAQSLLLQQYRQQAMPWPGVVEVAGITHYRLQRRHLLDTTVRPQTVSQAAQQAFWLGGDGHLFRNVSLLSYRLAATASPTAATSNNLDLQLVGRAYRIPYEPRSGRLSMSNRVVVVGDTVRDVHTTPMSGSTFGPEVLATVLDGLLTGEPFVHAVPWPVERLLTLGLALLATLAVVSFSRLLIGLAVASALVVGYGMLALAGLVNMGWWLPLGIPLVLASLGIVGAVLYRYWVQDHEKRRLIGIYGKYVSPQVMDTLLKTPDKALRHLKGHREELTVLFADLRNFTQLFEAWPPEMITELLNDYFDCMTRIILAHGGTHDKFMGDAIMAFFGAPAPLPNHAEAACKAAIEMQQALVVFNQRWKDKGLPPLQQAIGIGTGPMLVGNFGSHDLLDFTVMGQTVNLAARLETLNRQLGTDILLNEQAARAVETQLGVTPLGHHAIKGFTERVPVWQLGQPS